jgi:hypothetical protein
MGLVLEWTRLKGGHHNGHQWAKLLQIIRMEATMAVKDRLSSHSMFELWFYHSDSLSSTIPSLS